MHKMFAAYVSTLLTHSATPLYIQTCSSSTWPPTFSVWFRLELLCSLTQREIRVLMSQEMDTVSHSEHNKVFIKQDRVKKAHTKWTSRNNELCAALQGLYQERVVILQNRPGEDGIHTRSKVLCSGWTEKYLCPGDTASSSSTQATQH